MSGSSTTEANANANLSAYSRERLPIRLVLPVPLLLASFATGARGGTIEFRSLAESFLICLGLFVQFRIWDDLADREGDRIAHPNRVLVRAGTVLPFVASVTALGGVNILLAWLARGSFVALLTIAVIAFYAVWYGGLRRTITNPLASAHLLLIKYPAFAFIAGGAPLSLSASPWIAAVYAAAVAYEILHDRRLRTGSARAWLLCDLFVLAGTIVYLASRALPISLRDHS